VGVRPPTIPESAQQDRLHCRRLGQIDRRYRGAESCAPAVCKHTQSGVQGAEAARTCHWSALHSIWCGSKADDGRSLLFAPGLSFKAARHHGNVPERVDLGSIDYHPHATRGPAQGRRGTGPDRNRSIPGPGTERTFCSPGRSASGISGRIPSAGKNALELARMGGPGSCHPSVGQPASGNRPFPACSCGLRVQCHTFLAKTDRPCISLPPGCSGGTVIRAAPDWMCAQRRTQNTEAAGQPDTGREHRAGADQSTKHRAGPPAASCVPSKEWNKTRNSDKPVGQAMRLPDTTRTTTANLGAEMDAGRC
jgi:hypothetical protein